MTHKERIQGAIFGMAIGDAFGYPTEFLSVAEIYEKWAPDGPLAPEGNPILVTDDTQMAIAVAKGLMNARAFAPQEISEELIKTYILWLNDPRNNRAPGMTCLSSVGRLEQGKPWKKATAQDSKGCGANMRVVPVGGLVIKGNSLEEIAALAQLQSALTHAHPTALTASAITAITISFLLTGTTADELFSKLRTYISTQKETYYKEWLGDIWNRPPFWSETEFIQLGWKEISEVLTRVEEGLRIRDTSADPCEVIGEGWIAEESFATALYCFLLFPNDPVKVIRRAAISSGDSDSIACLAGSFAGAYNGIQSLPPEWVARIEYKKELEEIIEFLSK